MVTRVLPAGPASGTVLLSESPSAARGLLIRDSFNPPLSQAAASESRLSHGPESVLSLRRGTISVSVHDPPPSRAPGLGNFGKSCRRRAVAAASGTMARGVGHHARRPPSHESVPVTWHWLRHAEPR